MKRILPLLVFVVGFAIGLLCPSISTQRAVEPQRDTLYLRDTIIAYKAVISKVRIVDTMMVYATDTITLRDTFFVYLPKEQVEWEDSLCSVWVSGYQPKVDSVYHYIRESIVYEKVEPSRWGIGFVAGYGAGKEGFSPFVGVGVTYSLFTKGSGKIF